MSSWRDSVSAILAVVSIFVPWVRVIAVAFAAWSSKENQRIASNRARDAYNASLNDRMVLIRSSTAARNVVLGEDKTSGVLAFVGNSGANSEYLHVVVALAGHQCQSIGEIWLNDQPLGTLDGSGDVTAGTFYVNKGDIAGSVTTTTSGSPAGTTYTIPLAGAASVVSGSVSITNGVAFLTKTSPLVLGTHYTIAANVITWTALAPASTAVQIQYRLSASLKLVNVRKYLGTTSQTVDSTLNTAFPSQWTTTHQGKGVTYIALRLQYDENAFPTGVPNITAQIKGALVFDPRTSTTAWSDNPALLARHYLTMSSTLGGFGCATSEIDDATVIAAANTCDELINFDAVTTGKRYLCGCTLSTAADRRQNLQIILDSMAGGATYVQGVWKIYAGAYRTPTITLTESDVIDTIDPQISPALPTDQTFNVMAGTFVDPIKYWQETEFPRVPNATYLSQDNGIEHLNTVKLPAVRDPLRAQMIAKQWMDRSRIGLTYSAAFKLTAYKLAPFDTVMLTLPRYGWSSKVFEVQERKFSMEGGCQLVLREINSGIYSWSYTSALSYTAAPSTTLPNPFSVATLGTITCASGTAQLSTLGDGTILSRISATWAVSTDSAVLMNGKTIVEWWRHDQSAAQAMRVELGGSAVGAMLGPVDDGEIYVVRACWRNGLGVQGQWNYVNHTVVGKTAVPPDPTGLTVTVQADGMRRFLITLPANVGDDIAAVVLRYQSGASGTWTSMTQLVPPVAITPQQGGTTVIIETRDPAAGTWSFGAKLVDTTGNYSTGTIFLVNQTLGAALVTAGGISAVPGGGNLLSNASFEAYTGSNGIADSWNTYPGSGVTSITNTWGGGIALHGSAGQLINATYAAGSEAGFVQGPVIVTPNQTYTFSCYFRSGANVNLIPVLALNWETAGAVFISGDQLADLSGSAFAAGNTATEWARFSITFKAPATAGAVRCYAFFRNISGAAIAAATSRIDAAQLQVGDLLTGFAPKEQEVLPGVITGSALNFGIGVNLLQNSGVNVDTAIPAHWDLTWVGTAGVSAGTLTLGVNLSTWHPMGLNSVYITASGTPTTSSIWGDIGNVGSAIGNTLTGAFDATKLTPVIAGQRYEVSAWVSAHRTLATVGVRWFDNTGAQISDQDASAAVNSNGIDYTNSVYQLGGFLTAPAGAVTANFRVRGQATGATNPFIFVAKAFFAAATPNQTVLSPWSPSSNYASLHGGELTGGSVGTTQITSNAATDIVTTSVGSTTVTQAAQTPTQNRQTFASITYTPTVSCTANLTCILTYILGATAGELHLGLFSSHTTGSVSEFVDFTPSGANTHYNAVTLTRQLALTAGVPVTWYLDGYMFAVGATDAIVTSAFMRIEAIKR